MNAPQENGTAFVGEAEGVSGRISFDSWQLRFEGLETSLQIPLPRLTLEWDPDNEERIIFRDAHKSEIAITSSDLSLLETEVLQRNSGTRHQIRALRQPADARRRLKLTGWFLAICAVGVLTINFAAGLMARALVARIPVQWEKKMGDEKIAELQQEFPFITDTARLKRLDHAVAPLVEALPKQGFQYQFYLVDLPVPNAFALPGGHVVVTTRLMEVVDRPEELAGAVAHEIAHVNKRHGLRQLLASVGPYVVFRMFTRSEDGFLGMLGEGSSFLISQSYSQQHELEADAVGWEYMTRAHIDPRGMTDLLLKLRVEEARYNGREAQAGPLSSHPATTKRIEKLEGRWKNMKNKDSFTPLSWDS